MEKVIRDLLKKYEGMRGEMKAKQAEEEKKPNGFMDLWYGGIACGYQKIIWDLEKILHTMEINKH